MRRQNIQTAIREARTPGTDIHRAFNGVCGCPAGGWAETQQALSRLVDALPLRRHRSYTVDDIVDAVLELDHADRYQWKEVKA